MTGVKRQLLAAVLIVASLCVAVVVGAVRLRNELQNKVDRLDVSALLQESGQSIRAAHFAWDESEFVWFPRPTLVLRGLNGRFHSGRPGPGQVSAAVALDELRVVSAWSRLFRGRVERVELSGGMVECAPDMLPSLPGFYEDPLDGTTRAVPWLEILSTVSDSVPGPARKPDMNRPALIARDLKVQLTDWEILPGCAFTIREARADRGTNGWDLWALLEPTCPGLGIRHLPVRIQGGGGVVRRVEAGQVGDGPALALETGAGGDWTMELSAVRGPLARAVMKGRRGLAGRMVWSGPWSLHAAGRGQVPAGVAEARLDLGPGMLRLLDGEAHIEYGVRGSLMLEPDMIMSPGLRIWSAGANEDSAGVEFEIRTSPHGVRSRGSVEGSLDLEWLQILGRGWGGQGKAAVDLGFSSNADLDGERFQISTEGALDGVYSSFSLPWLDKNLSSGSFRIVAGDGSWSLFIDGRMGSSPFRLKLDNLAQRLPGGGLWSDAASSWAFDSDGGRLEDFAASAVHAGGLSGVPFWLALPGRGRAGLAGGSLHGAPVEEFRMEVRRTLRSVEVEMLMARIAGGLVRGGRVLQATSADRTAPEPAPDLHIEADGLELELLAPAMQALGVDSQGLARGRLSGSIDLRWTPELEWEETSVRVNGAVSVENGEIRDHPILDNLRVWTGVDGLRVLPFRLGKVRFVRDGSGVLIWDSLAVDSDLLRIEGAGRITGGDTLRAVLRAEVGSGNGWMDLLRSALKPGTAAHLWIEGPSHLPEVRVIGASAYREARDRIRSEFTEASGRRQPSGSYR